MRDKDNLHGRNLVNLYDVIQIPKQYVMGSEDKESIIIDIKDYTYTAIPYIKLPFKWMYHVWRYMLIIKEFIFDILLNIKNILFYPYRRYRFYKFKKFLREITFELNENNYQ